MTTEQPGPGPFSTEAEVRELPAVRRVYAAFEADPGAGKMDAANMRLLTDALAAAGVLVGEFDLRIAEWLGMWEPATVAVIASWIERASGAGS